MARAVNPLSPRAVGSGAAVVVVVAIPLAIAGNAADEMSNVVLVLFLATFGAFIAGGYVGGRIGRAAPYSNSAVAAAAGWAIVQSISVVLTLVRGDDLALPAILVNGLAAYACGLIGGLLASRTSTEGAERQ